MNEAVTTLELYETLRDKLGDEATKRFIAYVDERIEREAVTKGDLREETAKVREDLRKEMARAREELRGEMAKVREELRGEIAKVREEFRTETAKIWEEMARIREEMAKMEGRLIRWMFLFWVGQVAAMLGILAFVLRS